MRPDWSEFLGRPGVAVDSAVAAAAVGGRRVLITGAGGSIGAELARAVAGAGPRSLVLLDSSESALYECMRRVDAGRFSPTPVVGSCGDSGLLKRLFENDKPDVVFHAAAYKHVPLMELNPFAAIANNSIGTFRLVTAAREAGVGGLVMVSTDKAVRPRSVMGVSKRVAELVVLSHAKEASRMNVVRLGNVLGSSGSVVPLFEEQARSGAAMTVSHPEATRYFLTPCEVETALLHAAASGMSGRVFVPECGEAFRIVDLARFVAGEAAARIELVGLRPGDKLHEELVSDDEHVAAERIAGMRVVASSWPAMEEIAAALARMEEAVAEFDRSKLLGVLMELVPSYRPDDKSSLLAVAAASEAR
jgi:FlaA1/EpsC-like NDP-sugar epimerase